jgi:cytochrome c-type biogenesis protein CcmH/NrfF
MFKRWGTGLAVCILAVGMLGAGDSGSRFNRIGHQMMCACSCGQMLLECNHVGCPDSDRMIGELRAQVVSGGGSNSSVNGAGSDTAILNWFVAKYGATVLAAPIRGGFDTVAWVTPLAIFFLSTIGTAVLIRVWKLRSGQRLVATLPQGNSGTEAIRERIRRETEY